MPDRVNFHDLLMVLFPGQYRESRHEIGRPVLEEVFMGKDSDRYHRVGSHRVTMEVSFEMAAHEFENALELLPKHLQDEIVAHVIRQAPQVGT